MTTRTGRCMCGAVKYEADVANVFSVCHCTMCQRWSAGVYMGVSTTRFELTSGADALTVFRSSDWASRAFCSECGSNVYYHAAGYGGESVALGSLDDTEGLEMQVQYFIDRKLSGFTVAEDCKKLTSSEIEAMIQGMKKDA